MGYIGRSATRRKGENMEFKDAISFEFALDTAPSDGTRTRALLSDNGTFEVSGTLDIPAGQKLALGCPTASSITITGGGTITGEGTITGGGFG